MTKINDTPKKYEVDIAMKGSRFDWYQPTDADFIDELVATVIDDS